MAKRLRDVCALPESECSGAPDAASSSAHWLVFDNSPAIYGWVHGSGMFVVPSGTKEMVCRPWWDFEIWVALFPAINGWAIFSESGFADACRVMAKRLRDVCALPESECSGAPDAASSSAHWLVFDNSPAIYGWVHGSGMFVVPSGTKEMVCRPWWDFEIWVALFPAINGWAIFSESGFADACRVMAKRLRDVCTCRNLKCQQRADPPTLCPVSLHTIVRVGWLLRQI